LKGQSFKCFNFDVLLCLLKYNAKKIAAGNCVRLR
jgi:hypothetical protein